MKRLWPKKSRVNVLGFLHPQGLLRPFDFEGRVDSAVIIACFNALCPTLTRSTPGEAGRTRSLSTPARLSKRLSPQGKKQDFSSTTCPLWP
ncbi:hypothetical protein [Nitrosococcus oceani]|uniref:hypothetical protein n=1 Tax=Nitrosococcus oceani TaxID=1229 RepID=UPI0002D4D066|nr:hypothetical protein [Nitrosococcus oceani]